MNNFFEHAKPLSSNNIEVRNTIYHYTSPQGLIGILGSENPKLFFTQYDSLNDLKERKDVLDFLYGYCEYRVKENLMPKELEEEIRKIELSDKSRIEHNLDKIIWLDDGEKYCCKTEMKNEDCYTYICSFSREPDLLPMWRMYSKSEHYEGYCLGLRSEDFKIRTSFGRGYKIELRNVVYTDSDKTAILDKLLIPIMQHYNEYSIQDKLVVIEIIKQLIFNYQFVFKNKAFEYEKEIRAILHVPKNLNSTLVNLSERKYRTVNGMIVPYVEYEIPHANLLSVNLAPSLKEEINKNNLTDFLVSKKYDNVKVYGSEIPLRVN